VRHLHAHQRGFGAAQRTGRHALADALPAVRPGGDQLTDHATLAPVRARALIRLDLDSADPAPAEIAALLARAAARAGPAADKYGDGEVVRECEAALARLLGKEKAVLFATGTLANVVALDRLCGPTARRVLLQADAHILNDTGDSAVALAGLMAIPLGPRGGHFTAEDVQREIEHGASGRVAQKIGAVAIETPVRRQLNRMFPQAALDGVIGAARGAGIKLHLDGARLPIAAAARGQSMAQFATPFDTVYLSLWKMLGLPFGSALAGPAALLDGVEHDRRRHGGALAQFWPIAALTLELFDRFESPWPRILTALAQVRDLLAGSAAFKVERSDDGVTNSFWLTALDIAPAAFRAAASERGLALAEPQGQRFGVRANISWLSAAPDEIVERLASAAAKRGLSIGASPQARPRAAQGGRPYEC
jgi:threonine aldolase